VFGLRRNFFNLDKGLKLAWIVPAHKNSFIHNKKSYTINYPNLFFYFKNTELYIYSYKVFNEEKTLLHSCPFPNIFSDERMCFGNIDSKKLLTFDLSQFIKNLENAFFKRIKE
jgi:hypothetical protein